MKPETTFSKNRPLVPYTFSSNGVRDHQDLTEARSKPLSHCTASLGHIKVMATFGIATSRSKRCQVLPQW